MYRLIFPFYVLNCCLCLITGSIAHSTQHRYLSYSEADFEVFRPAWATRCTDGVKFDMEEWTKAS